jgi:hypothetical protein
MDSNLIPLLISVSGGLLVFLVQQFLRPYLHAHEFLALFLGFAPNLITGFSFPFTILMRPGAFTRVEFGWLFPVWCAGTLLVLIAFEIVRPFKGAQSFDYLDIFASLVGVSLAAFSYYFWLRHKLVFRSEKF